MIQTSFTQCGSSVVLTPVYHSFQVLPLKTKISSTIKPVFFLKIVPLRFLFNFLSKDVQIKTNKKPGITD